MKQLVLWLWIFIPLGLFSQTDQVSNTTNSRYFEDQFYAGLTYNFILNQPEGVNQQNISYGIQTGFIKDIPMNQKRTMGFGVGVGLGLYTYYTNIRALDSGNEISYEIVDGVEDFKRSKLEMHLVEFPLEFRWRNSDASTYSFWRIYAGVKLGYAFNARSKYVLENEKESFRNTDIKSFQYGLTFNFGYHNFNIHAYYSLTRLYNDGITLSGNDIEISPLRIGLVFYIL
ncbi:porin family protein [Maribacter sp. 2308TA10-17]|uniref:porin family protein n=1 Tax=Maribacter sp. 2308TA10-17 TaxID=3386276 RepID=UPI0039BCD015